MTKMPRKRRGSPKYCKSEKKKKTQRKMGETSSSSSLPSSSSSSSVSLYLPPASVFPPPLLSALRPGPATSTLTTPPPSPPSPSLQLPASPLSLSAASSATATSSAAPSLSSSSVESRITNACTDRASNRKHLFRKKRNITGDGTLYERDFATICFLRGINHHDDFYLTAAVDALHPFDDVQFETRDRKSLRSSIIQLKHKHGKTLTKDALQGFGGDRSKRRCRDKSFIIKIFHAGFCKIRDMADEIEEQFGFINRFQDWDFILYTNCAVEENSSNDIWNAIAEVGCGNSDIATSEEYSSCGTGCFLLKDTYRPWQYFSPDFLDKFRLYAGQAGESDMERIIHNEISANKAAWGEDPSEVIASNLCNFMEKWLTKETLPLDASIKDKFLKKLNIKKNSDVYVPWFPLD